MQFVPVPHEALGLVTPLEYGAVTDLYFRAHRLRWRPFTVTTRSLVTAWGLPTRKVWDVLTLLESAGLLTLERGDHRRPTTVAVINPVGSGARQEAEHSVEHSTEHSAERSKALGTKVIDEPGTLGGTLVGTLGGTILDETRDLRPETETRDEQQAPPADRPPVIRKQLDLTPPAVAAPDEWTQLAAHYASLPGCMKPRDRKNGNGEHLDTILRKAGSLAAAVNLLEWWMYAPGARQLRTGSHDGSESDAAPVYGLKTLARPKNTDGYLEQALSWAKQRNPPRRKLSTDTAPKARRNDFADEPTRPVDPEIARRFNLKPKAAP